VSQLTVSINNDGLHSIAAPEAFETVESFDLVLDNDGEAVHVHLNLDETLSAVADIRANNHYVEPTGSRPVGIDVNPRTAAVTGRLKIATGYGSEVAYTRITVQPPEADPTQVTVDKSLANPQREAPTEPTAAERADRYLSRRKGWLGAFDCFRPGRGVGDDRRRRHTRQRGCHRRRGRCPARCHRCCQRGRGRLSCCLCDIARDPSTRLGRSITTGRL